MTTPSASAGDESRRRLSHDECVELLTRPVVGVFSTVGTRGRIHSVPVHFLYRDIRPDTSVHPDARVGDDVHGGEVRILCGTSSVKLRNVRHTGRAALCVEVTDGSDRRYVSIEGNVRVETPPAPEDLLALDRRYSRTDFSTGWSEDDHANAAMLVLRPVRWIAWSDWD